MIFAKIAHSLKKLFPFLFGLFIVGGLWWRLIVMRAIPFYDWDEAIYAQVAREWMRHPGLTLTYNGSLWFEKPPLLFALIESLFQLFGISEIITRMPSTIASIFALLYLWQLVQKVLKSELHAYTAVLLTVSATYYLDRTGLVNVDIFLTLGWLMYLGGNSFKSRLISTCIGTWTKSFLGLIPLVVDIAVSLWHRTLTLSKIKESLATLVLALSWHVYMSLVYQNAFITSHVYEHLISRVQKPIELHAGTRWFYLEHLWQNYSFLLSLAGIAILMWAYRLVRRQKAFEIDRVFVLSLSYLALLTVSKAKLSWYVTPLLPLAALMIVYLISQIGSGTVRKLATICLIVWGAFQFAQKTLGASFDYSVPSQVMLARCKNHLPSINKLGYLVSPSQRTDAHVIEAAQLNIGSSFIYGSVPAFVFYLDRPVTFYYKTDLFLKDLGLYDAMVMHHDDIALKEKAEKALAPGITPLFTCTRGEMTMTAKGSGTADAK
jgi:4-amino-4-deoxy-L-arabinose transferase-like glycosyltransferase